MAVAEKSLASRLRNKARTDPANMQEFDRGWASLLAEIDRLQKRELQLQDLVVENLMSGGGSEDRDKLNEDLARVRAELAPLLKARSDEGALRQRVVTEMAGRRFEEIAAERRKIEHEARTALTDLRSRAEELRKADAHLRALGDKDAELANEQTGCNDRGRLSRHVPSTFQGVGLGNVEFLLQRIEEDLITIARRAGG